MVIAGGENKGVVYINSSKEGEVGWEYLVRRLVVSSTGKIRDDDMMGEMRTVLDRCLL